MGESDGAALNAAKRLDDARARMRRAATARTPVVSAADIHIVLAALASAQAALHDLREGRRVGP